MTPTVPVPHAIRHLIESNNKLLKLYQTELTDAVMEANMEMMKLLKLDPAEGWRLDMEAMTYVKIETNDSPVGE